MVRPVEERIVVGGTIKAPLFHALLLLLLLFHCTIVVFVYCTSRPFSIQNIGYCTF